MNHRSNWQKRPSQHRAQHQPTGRVSHVVLSQREFVTRASCTFESRCPGDGVPLNLTLWQGKLHTGGSTMFHTFFFFRIACHAATSNPDWIRVGNFPLAWAAMDLTVITYSSPREPRLRLPEPNKFKKCGPVKYGMRTRNYKKNLKNCTYVPFHIFNQTPDIKQCHESDMLMKHMCIKQVCVCVK